MPDDVLRITPLGGLGEVGKNMMVYEIGGEAVVVDAGIAFPRDEHLGVDLILPDLTYLRDRGRPIRAVLLTHAHEDHVGGLPYLMREVRVDEVWATPPTRSGPASRAPSAWSVRRSARSSRAAPAGSSSRRSRRTSTGCSRRSTSPSTWAGRCASSAARCART